MDTSLKNIDFEPLTEVKARLSEKVARVDREGRLLAITLNGKPKVIMMSYQAFLDKIVENTNHPKVETYEEWLQGSKQRKAKSKYIKSLFDFSLLTRVRKKNPVKEAYLKKLAVSEKGNRSSRPRKP